MTADHVDEQCTLCDLPVEGSDVTADGNRFCCVGCRDVYDALGDVEVDVDADAVRRAREDDADDPEIPSDHETTYLEVDGMYCATCEAFIESVATETDGVSAASASYVTETVRIDHNGDAVSQADLEETISQLGYSAYDRDDAFSRRGLEPRPSMITSPVAPPESVLALAVCVPLPSATPGAVLTVSSIGSAASVRAPSSIVVIGRDWSM